MKTCSKLFSRFSQFDRPTKRQWRGRALATDPAPAMQIARRSCRRRNRSGKAPGSLPLLLLSATWGTIIVAPLTSTLAAAAIVEESPSPPRLPSFPSVAEAVGSAAAVAVISARSELSERQLKHTSREHWLPRAVESLRAQGRVGTFASALSRGKHFRLCSLSRPLSFPLRPLFRESLWFPFSPPPLQKSCVFFG